MQGPRIEGPSIETKIRYNSSSGSPILGPRRGLKTSILGGYSSGLTTPCIISTKIWRRKKTYINLKMPRMFFSGKVAVREKQEIERIADET